MKKILLGMLGAGIAASVFGQGTVFLDNQLNSSAYVSINGPYNGENAAAAGTYQVALLWFNGSSFQQIGAVYQTSATSDGPGYFYGEVVTVPVYQGTGTFIVQGWTGHFANYAAAEAGGSLLGQTSSFVSGEGNSTVTPPGSPVLLALPHPGPGNWDGNLILTAPEPSTMALGGLGALALWYFRRRK